MSVKSTDINLKDGLSAEEVDRLSHMSVAERGRALEEAVQELSPEEAAAVQKDYEEAFEEKRGEIEAIAQTLSDKIRSRTLSRDQKSDARALLTEIEAELRVLNAAGEELGKELGEKASFYGDGSDGSDLTVTVDEFSEGGTRYVGALTADPFSDADSDTDDPFSASPRGAQTVTVEVPQGARLREATYENGTATFVFEKEDGTTAVVELTGVSAKTKINLVGGLDSIDRARLIPSDLMKLMSYNGSQTTIAQEVLGREADEKWGEMDIDSVWDRFGPIAYSRPSLTSDIGGDEGEGSMFDVTVDFDLEGTGQIEGGNQTREFYEEHVNDVLDAVYEAQMEEDGIVTADDWKKIHDDLIAAGLTEEQVSVVFRLSIALLAQALPREDFNLLFLEDGDLLLDGWINPQGGEPRAEVKALQILIFGSGIIASRGWQANEDNAAALEIVKGLSPKGDEASLIRGEEETGRKEERARRNERAERVEESRQRSEELRKKREEREKAAEARRNPTRLSDQGRIKLTDYFNRLDVGGYDIEDDHREEYLPQLLDLLSSDMSIEEKRMALTQWLQGLPDNKRDDMAWFLVMATWRDARYMFYHLFGNPIGVEGGGRTFRNYVGRLILNGDNFDTGSDTRHRALKILTRDNPKW